MCKTLLSLQPASDLGSDKPLLLKDAGALATHCQSRGSKWDR